MKGQRRRGGIRAAFSSLALLTKSAQFAPRAGYVSDPLSGCHGSGRRTSIHIPVDDACGGTVGNYVVCSPACLIRCLQGSKMFLIRGQPLRPPGSAQYPEPIPAAALQGALLGMEVRIRRIQDLVLHIVALGPAQIRSNP